MKFVFTYTGMRVQDMDRSIRFYTEVLGMELLNRGKIEKTKGETAALKSEDSPQILELNWYAEDSPVADPYCDGEELDHLGFGVDNLDEALKLLKEKGHPTVLKCESEEGQWAYVEDPDGNWIELFEMPE